MEWDDRRRISRDNGRSARDLGLALVPELAYHKKAYEKAVGCLLLTYLQYTFFESNFIAFPF